MKEKLLNYYMQVAERTAELSTARRLKVGAVIVKDDIMIPGYNGTFPGEDNNCEHEVMVDDVDLKRRFMQVYRPTPDMDGEMFIFEGKFYTISCEGDEYVTKYNIYELITKSDVLHAEANALGKLINSTLSSSGADLFMTHSPCINCAINIARAGIKNLYYRTKYRTDDGIKKLIERGVNVEQV